MKRYRGCIRWSAMFAALALLAACQREGAAPSAGPEAIGPEVEQAEAGVAPELKDVVETDRRFIIGITYPPEANKYPGMALELHRYVQAARADLMEAVEDAPVDGSAGPYELSLVFETVADSPRVFAMSANGYSYTGGAHGAPLVARFVWLPEQQRALRIGELLQGPGAWADLSSHVREQLHAALSQRVDADDLDPAERGRVMRAAGRMIDEGTAAEADNFSTFEPVLGQDGRIVALRFVFAPYQVGPYSDGEQRAEVPAAVLLPHVSEAYRELFAGS
ncbi:DUF3298 domain-containing protein [Luteimonas aestuarii]|uniref:DUF3298 domain-containing protein n=1 Tax=Luteimonas aestuarii TaxID=453837 RepID=A0A4R5TJB1_9GAMM|nr:DUF3298 and DUF4163 domain-containing protein [Luteimonas aestuarii]TDK21526.1 DUF3298 domain-containing protein [Luteimonas aestuarii]